MRRAAVGAMIGIATLVGVAGTASGAANPKASCTGILVSSVAGQPAPGLVADLTRQFHQEFKDAGLPPGAFDSATSHEHAGGVGECLGP
jgi:hypothetical protein